ncbi:hypothetical protein [Aeromicrobium piscarium]|uniref:hypothetical protein n=1 Tax=Aeromicrobium piscarium TaxID=2590901 RepID=UPI00163DAA70|nr:hypothetical protein [Aeromicrobium piscarium]
MRLAVELYGHIIGTLEGDTRAFDFLPTASGIERFGANSPVEGAFPQLREQTLGFIATLR